MCSSDLFEISKGSITLTGPFEKKFILKMRHGQIHYRIGPSPPHDLEAKAVFGTVRSEMEDILPRPYFPLGKRIFVLTPEGKGEVYLRTTFGTITLGH